MGHKDYKGHKGVFRSTTTPPLRGGVAKRLRAEQASFCEGRTRLAKMRKLQPIWSGEGRVRFVRRVSGQTRRWLRSLLNVNEEATYRSLVRKSPTRRARKRVHIAG